VQTLAMAEHAMLMSAVTSYWHFWLPAIHVQEQRDYTSD